MNQFIGIAVFLTAFLIGSAATTPAKRNEVAIAADPPVAATSELAPVYSEPVSEDLPIYGWYALDEFKAMREVTMVYIYDPGTIEEEAGGGVFTTFEKYGDQGFFGTSWIKIRDSRVTFKTEEINGISYEFDGTFPQGRTVHWEGEKPLYGTLQKFVQGKMVAETSGNFEYFETHCWH